MSGRAFVPYRAYREYPLEEMKQRAADFFAEMKRRRSVRHFSNRPVPVEIIQDCIRAASSAPSGANNQPWTFVVVSNPEIKKQIHQAAEIVEREFYAGEATKEWVEALDHLGTDQFKPFLVTAPYLIVIFAQRHGYDADGQKKKHYYVQQSVGIATGILITALHNAGLVSLTYTPAKMAFLNKVLSRPSNEKPFMILVTGYPADDAQVPVLGKKSLGEVAIFM
ncbi:MAG: nitroreductase family protein [Deltaproteobacteria bacterium]|nr:nitroreductase family protein [Deltaproteobacteria bacterium]